jgi:hypothetical protein
MNVGRLSSSHLVPVSTISLSRFESTAIGNGVVVGGGSSSTVCANSLRWPFDRHGDGQERASRLAVL